MVRIKWYLLPKQAENRCHNNDRDKKSHIESKQISETIMVRIKWHLDAEQLENNRFMKSYWK